MPFNIQITDHSIPPTQKRDGHAEAILIIDDFSEDIALPIDYWSPSDYRSQWVNAVDILLNSSEETAHAALITEMYDPLNPRYAIMWWPIYKVGDTVYIRNGYLVLDEVGLTKDFSLGKLYELVSARHADDTASEWEVKLEDLHAWRAEITQT